MAPDFLVLLEPGVHGLPVGADEAGEGAGVEALGRIQGDDLLADVLARDVEGRVVGDLPDVERAEGVENRLAAAEGADPARARGNMADLDRGTGVVIWVDGVVADGTDRAMVAGAASSLN
jgi:hypothetical protein